ncbi:hypothetical protein [Robertkochia flava]|uniref:hypothetical protein n=1 Tax=Robertkochia flava TaxID=3447986 RepID=UPI001CCB81D7|nr:hypothetical protein [Robertkochia marina]
MKKDIKIPEPEGLYLAAVRTFNEELGENVWDIFLLNAGQNVKETMMIVLRGYSEDKKTSVMRKKLEALQPGSFGRLEFLREELLDFRNEYLVTWFEGSVMYEKNFVLEPGQVSEEQIEWIATLGMAGVLFS